MSFRTEEKLKVDASCLPVFVGWLANSGAQLLHPPRRVVSVYLDNDRLAMYHDSIEGVLPRKKLRFRRYEPCVEPATSWVLESKISAIEGRFKTSTPVTESTAALTQYLIDDLYGVCRPRVEVSYRRSYFITSGIRVTIDQDLRYRRVSMSGLLHSTSDPNIAIEVKGPHDLPAGLLNALFPWDRARFSKYCRAIETVLFHADPRFI